MNNNVILIREDIPIKSLHGRAVESGANFIHFELRYEPANKDIFSGERIPCGYRISATAQHIANGMRSETYGISHPLLTNVMRPVIEERRTRSRDIESKQKYDGIKESILLEFHLAGYITKWGAEND